MQPPPSTPNSASRKDLFLAMSGIAASAVVVAFDATIISTSLPQVVLALDGMDLYAWAGTGYSLASAIAILIFGRLGDLFGRKPLMIASMILVVVGSVLARAIAINGAVNCFSGAPGAWERDDDCNNLCSASRSVLRSASPGALVVDDLDDVCHGERSGSDYWWGDHTGARLAGGIFCDTACGADRHHHDMVVFSPD